MEESLKQRLTWYNEASGVYSWNFKVPENNIRLMNTIKRKLYKKLCKYPELFSVHRNGSISMTALSKVAPKAVLKADEIIQDLVARYKEQGVWIEEKDNLSVI